MPTAATGLQTAIGFRVVPFIPPLICTPDGLARRGCADWRSLPRLGPPVLSGDTVCSRSFLSCVLCGAGRWLRLGWWCPVSFTVALVRFFVTLRVAFLALAVALVVSRISLSLLSFISYFGLGDVISVWHQHFSLRRCRCFDTQKMSVEILDRQHSNEVVRRPSELSLFPM
jgi:hypothetical protein